MMKTLFRALIVFFLLTPYAALAQSPSPTPTPTPTPYPTPLPSSVDMTTEFGAAANFTQLPLNSCQMLADHLVTGIVTSGSVGIASGGSDSAVVWLQCNNIFVTNPIAAVTVNGRTMASALFHFPIVVTSTSAGVWTIQVGNLQPLTIFVQ
jgi:hypothetical protein